MTLGELVEVLGGKLAQGNPEWEVEGVSSSARACAFHLVFAEDAASAAKALARSSGMVVLRAGLVDPYPPDYCIVEADQPRLWFALAPQLLKPMLPATGVHSAAVIGEGAELGENVTVGPCAVVGEYAQIGAGTRIRSEERRVGKEGR